MKPGIWALGLRVLGGGLRRTGILVLLRLTGLTLAAVLAAAVPVFVSGAMEQTLHKEIAATPDATAIVLDWTSPDETKPSDGVNQLSQYLKKDFPASAGLAALTVVTLPATAPMPVQVVGDDGKVQPGKKYLSLGVLPESPGPAAQAGGSAPAGESAAQAGGSAPAPGVALVSGRLPAPGKAEVLLPDSLLARSGYKLGQKLRVPLTADSAGAAATVTIVGSANFPDSGPLTGAKSALENSLLTSPAYWDSLSIPAGQMTWAVTLPPDQLHAANLPTVAKAVRELSLQATRLLPDVDLAASPATFLDNFLAQMTATRKLLAVVLLPVYLLVLFFTLATAEVVVSSRAVEVAVLRSRGARPLQALAFYLGESLLLAGSAALLGLLLTVPTVHLMGLFAGFLQLVDRPLLPATLTWAAVAWAAGTALAAEAISLLPLARTARFTVATMGQESETVSPVLATLRAVGEIGLLAIVGYGTWQLFVLGGSGNDPLYLSLPALALLGAGVVIWRALTLLLHLLHRLAGRWLSPPFYLALSLLRSKPGRYQSLWLMLVVTTGLGIYGAAFARTLDRDLTARARYQNGSDLLLKPYWESEIVSYDANGNPDQIVYREPPYSPMQNLPDTAGAARVQTRRNITLMAGSKSLGKTDVMAIAPQEFGKVAEFIPELTPYPPAQYLNVLARDEEAVLVSASLAQRLNIKPGEQLKAKQSENEVNITVGAIVDAWPGRLPEQGDFIVGSLGYFQDGLGLAPYDVWLRMTDGGSVQHVADALRQRSVPVVSLTDQQAVVAAGRREPLRLGLYATLSIGFVAALLVMSLTYLLSVGLTLQSRAKELGVLRAMGMSPWQVALSLYTEQLLLVGTAAATGLWAGGQAAAAYVPVLRNQPGQSLLPLATAGTAGERLWLLLGFAAALGAGVATVGLWLKHLSIGKALRLGEDG